MWGQAPEYRDLFVGRTREQDELVSALPSHRLISITGAAGVGKTRLVAHTLHSRLPETASVGRVGWADLGALTDARGLLGAVAQAVGFADHTSRPPLDALSCWLADREVLLVLDSCEHLVAACRELTADLLTTCPGLTVVTTSRQRLGSAGEAVIDIGPLPHGRGDSDAFTLLIERALAVAPALSVRHPRQDEDLTSICTLLEGMPLALELAAGQLMHRPVEELSATLRRQHEGLTAAWPRWPRRHRSLRTAIGWSHELCAPLERLLWARLSVFRGTFDEDAARAVCSGGPLSAGAVPSALAGLVAKSVVRQETDGRLRLPASVREYGWMWLGELHQRRPLQDRHAEHFLTLARSADAGWPGAGQAGWYQRIGSAHADLRAALDHLMAVDTDRAAELAGLVGFFWSCCGHLREARSYLEQLLPLCRTHSRARARAQWALGFAVALQGEHSRAVALGRRCARDARFSGTAEEQLAAAYLLGITHLLSGEAHEAYTVAQAALQQACDPPAASPSVLRCRLVRVFALTSLGRLDEAARAASVLRADCAAREECWTRAYTDYQLALIALAQGDPATAGAHVRAMLAGKRRLGDSFGIALGLDLLAAAAAAEGDGTAAALISGAGETYWRSVGHSQRGMPELRDVRAACWATARAAVGDGLFEQAYGQGMQADPVSIVALAVEGRLPGGV
ncbi:ATP-binding protein [Streptomyces venezuelae]